MALAGFEQRQRRASAVRGDLERAALEARGPEVEPLDRFEAQVLGVPRSCLRSIGHPDVHVIETSHATGW